ncbi:DNA repair protein RecN [Helicovermis profundi]|uniref:DNA repair protein RecN n=1 Tax=Helicovermis profundi TaxID=3065157 RepID=A0AAU9E3N9_9FIRM|nr:DNA repair protein RecN [Clostridia bacterium S502]
MIFDLSIKNFILIDEVNLEFKNKFNIITGETGAGKSIVFKAIDIVLGAKANKDLLKDKEKSSYIQISFDITNRENLRNELEALGYSIDDDTIVFSREIKPSGKTISRINSLVTSISVIKSLRNKLIEITSQNEQQNLLKKNNHIVFLDKFINENISSILLDVEATYGEILEKRKALLTLSLSNEEIQRNLDVCLFQLNDIEEVDFKENEENILEEKYNYIKNFEIITNTIEDTKDKLFSENGVISLVDSVKNSLVKITNYDTKISSFNEQIANIYFTLESLKSDIRNYSDNLTYDKEELFNIENRLDQINKIKRKYGKTFEDIFLFKQNLISQIQNYQTINDRRKTINRELDEKKEIYNVLATKLSNLRKKGAIEFIKNISDELLSLNMKNVVFDINFKVKDEISKNGIDDIEFFISTNLGQALTGLSKIVSGGELSRIMLAIKTITNDESDVLTLIFDEIDSGISGKTAAVVGSKINAISKRFQVISVTHLPQIAVFANNHIYIEKNEEENSTSASVRLLEDKEKINEIARMLSGENVTRNSIINAKELLQNAREK